jgi:starvation-inducible DNA-binding protein
MQKADIGIKQENIDKIVKMLGKIFADENILYTKIKSFHWNVEDHNFRDYHLFFDDLAATSIVKIDEIAERVRALGRAIPSYLAFYLENTQLKENTSTKLSGKHMIEELLNDYETQIKILRKCIDEIADLGDAGTTDFLTGIMEGKEKQAWMIRSSNM